MHVASPNEKQTVFETKGPASWRIVPFSEQSPARQLRAEEMTAYVHGIAPWKVIAHFTFEWEASIWSAQKAVERFMRKNLPDVTYFYALEQNPGRPGFHVHMLWADCEAVQRRQVWNKWFQSYGRNRIEPVRGITDVARYCSKYVSKEGAWWNVKIVNPDLWHAARQVRNSSSRVPPTARRGV